MADKSKSEEQLISELEGLRQRSARPEVSEAERKHAEEALRSAHARLRATFDAIQENMNIVDLDFYLTDVNEVLIKTFGLSNRESVLGRKCFEVLKGRKDICPSCAVAEAYQSKAPVYRTTTPEDVVRTPGKSFEVFAYPIMDENGNISGAVEFARDITSRKQAEHELRKSEERLRAVLEAVPDLVIVLDAEGHYREIFTADSDLLYAPAEELLNKSIHDVLPQEDSQQIQEIIDRALVTGELQLYEYKMKTGGIERWFAGRATKFSFQNVDCVLWCARDITARKEAEDALRKREDELASQSRHLEEVNAALNVLLKRREEDKEDLEGRVLANVKELVLPYVEKLKSSSSYSEQMTLVGILESNIRQIVSPFASKLSSRFLSLTPTEIQVASLIRDGKSSKEIAALLNASENTVRSHRFNMRNKLGLTNKKVNMRSYLKSYT
jgi:PAS domain S-box-containing protein